MQQEQILKLEGFNRGTNGALALQHWQNARNKREEVPIRSHNGILEHYVRACRYFMKHIIDHSGSLSDIIKSMEWTLLLIRDNFDLVSNKQHTWVLNALLKYEEDDDCIEIDYDYDMFCNSIPYGFTGGLYNCIDELLYTLYDRAKEIDKKFYSVRCIV